MKKLVLLLLIIIPPTVYAQTGPGGVHSTNGSSALQIWMDALDLDGDGIVEGYSESVVSAGTVTEWMNKSGHINRDLDLGTPPNFINSHSGFNNNPAVSFVADSLHYLQSSNNVQLAPSNGITVFMVTDDQLFCLGCSSFNWRDITNTGNFVIEGDSSAYYSWGYNDGGWENISSSGYSTTNSFIFSTQIASSGANQFRNGSSVVTGTGWSVNNTDRPWGIGRNLFSSADYLTYKVSEIIVYDGTLNIAQRIIVENYLSAKHNIALDSNDIYDEDNAGNGNYDWDVAGIGRINASNIHNDAQGTGIVRILNPGGLGDDEFLIWGHDNGTLRATETTDVPAPVQARFDRVWRASEVNSSSTAVDVGSIDVRFDFTGLGTVTASDLRLLVDTDNDGVFNDETPIGGATALGGNVYQFTGVTAIANNLRFTLGTINKSPTGPGGVGTTDGISSLELWFKANAGVTTVDSNVSHWADQSGKGNDLQQTTPANRPTLSTSVALNGESVISYLGSNSQFFTSSFTGPGVDDLTIFLVANGTSYQSLLRWQDKLGEEGDIYTVYPWEIGGGRTFITSSDGGTTGGLSSGLVNAVNNIGVAVYARNTTNGMQTYRNGSLVDQKNTLDNIMPTAPFFSGRYNPLEMEYPTCDVGEMIVFNSQINAAQLIIITNYLSAKFNVTLDENDLYNEDDAGAGNFDYDVAGIGRINASNIHNDAQGTGIVRILNPGGLGDDEFLIWGHDNGTQQATETSDVPAPVQARFDRVWRASEVNSSSTAVDVGSIDVRFDLTGLDTVTASDLRLLVDTDNDGVFNDETPIDGATALGENVYQFTGVTAIANNLRFTLGTLNTAQTPLPIELVSFNATLLYNKTIRIDWQTASEINNDYFTIERSTNGVDWQELTRINGAGNSSSLLSYESIDNSPYMGISYYRLKQTDFDGQFSYSQIRSINIESEGGSEIEIFPNPTESQITIIVNAYELDQVKIYNTLGQDVTSFTNQINTSNSKLIIDLSELREGMYYIKTKTTANKVYKQ